MSRKTIIGASACLMTWGFCEVVVFGEVSSDEHVCLRTEDHAGSCKCDPCGNEVNPIWSIEVGVNGELIHEEVVDMVEARLFIFNT